MLQEISQTNRDKQIIFTKYGLYIHQGAGVRIWWAQMHSSFISAGLSNDIVPGMPFTPQGLLSS